MISDLNSVIEELESESEDGIFPVTLSRISNEGQTYTEINTDLIFILRRGGLLGILEHPQGLTVELDDKYNGLDIKYRNAYILTRMSEDKLHYMGQICTRKGQLLDVHALDNQFYIDKIKVWMEEYASEIEIQTDIHMLKGAADYKEHALEEKYKEVVAMGETGAGLENLAENPFEDLYYSQGADGPEPYLGRSKPEKEE